MAKPIQYCKVKKKKRNRLTGLENKLMVTEKSGGRYSSGVWDPHVHTAIFKMDNQ